MKEFADPTQSAHTAGPVETAAAHMMTQGVWLTMATMDDGRPRHGISTRSSRVNEVVHHNVIKCIQCPLLNPAILVTRAIQSRNVLPGKGKKKE